MDKPKIHIFCGYSGCGKSTVGKRLAKEEGMTHITTSDIVKELGGAGSEKVKEGQLFEGEQQLRNLLLGRINHCLKDEKPIILDGFPRTIDQYNWLIDNFGDHLGHFIYFDLEPSACIQHLLKRGRTDIPGYDEEEQINKRLAREAETYPFLWTHILKRRGFVNVDDHRPMSEVYADILHIIRTIPV